MFDMKNRGYSLIEFLFAVAIATVVVMMITFFARDIFILNYSSQSSMTSLLEGRKIMSVMVSELRSITPSAQGSYAIETAATNTITFFTDTNGDNISDRVRYFIDPLDRTVKRGLVLAAGSPPAYNLGSESFSTLMSDVANSTTTSLFEYYDSNYAGTSTPLALPINISLVRLVKINVRIEKNVWREPLPTIISSQASFRNLKDNL